MLPFAVLGFVMKPLQLKGASFLHIDFLWFSRPFPAISKQFLDTGFAPVESKQATTATETSSVEVHGTSCLWY